MSDGNRATELAFRTMLERLGASEQESVMRDLLAMAERSVHETLERIRPIELADDR